MRITMHILSEEVLSEIRNFLRAGRLIDAIRLYREHTGTGLKEAREQVERMQRSLGRSPGSDAAD